MEGGNNDHSATAVHIQCFWAENTIEVVLHGRE